MENSSESNDMFNSSVNSTDFQTEYLRHNLLWTVIFCIAYALILIVGTVGNIMVILVVTLRPKMRTVTNLFIMNLAFADLFVIMFCVPATLLANIITPWILGSFMCKGVAYVQGVSVCASAYSLAAISIDRCLAIYHAMERPRGLSKSQALFTILLIWLVALTITIPWAVIFRVITSPPNDLSFCVELWENESLGNIYFLVANLICCYILPLSLISISNVIIWCHVSHRKVPQDSSNQAITELHRKTRHGVRKMLGIVTLTFLLSWLPLYVIVVKVKFSGDSGESESRILDVAMPFAQWLGSWNSSVNPILYGFLNSKFRRMFKSLIPSWIPFVNRNGQKIGRNNEPGKGTPSSIRGPRYTRGTRSSSASLGSLFTFRSSSKSSEGRGSRREWRQTGSARGSSLVGGRRRSSAQRTSNQRTDIVAKAIGTGVITDV